MYSLIQNVKRCKVQNDIRNKQKPTSDVFFSISINYTKQTNAKHADGSYNLHSVFFKSAVTHLQVNCGLLENIMHVQTGLPGLDAYKYTNVGCRNVFNGTAEHLASPRDVFWCWFALFQYRSPLMRLITSAIDRKRPSGD